MEDDDGMAELYRDRFVSCTDDAVVIRWYYPWGARTIPYSSIRSVTRVDLSAFRGNWRIWGTSNPRYWASLDPGRPGKQTGLILDTGGPVRAFVTPDDAGAVADVIVSKASLPGVQQGGSGPVV